MYLNRLKRKKTVSKFWNKLKVMKIFSLPYVHKFWGEENYICDHCSIYASPFSQMANFAQTGEKKSKYCGGFFSIVDLRVTPSASNPFREVKLKLKAKYVLIYPSSNRLETSNCHHIGIYWPECELVTEQNRVYMSTRTGVKISRLNSNNLQKT